MRRSYVSPRSGETPRKRSTASEEAGLGGSALLSSPARRFVENHNDRLDECPLPAHSVRIPPSAGGAAGMPLSAATARDWLRKGGVTQRLCAAPSSRSGSHTHALLSFTLWVARSSVSSRVARRLPGRHSSVAASPLRCRTGLPVGRSTSGRPPPGGLKVVFLPAGTCWTHWQIGGDCSAIAGSYAAGALFRASATYPGSS